MLENWLAGVSAKKNNQNPFLHRWWGIAIMRSQAPAIAIRLYVSGRLSGLGFGSSRISSSLIQRRVLGYRPREMIGFALS